MKFTIIPALAGLTATVSGLCLLPQDSNTIATNFGKLISAYSDQLANVR
jgi:hypothetical protein